MLIALAVVPALLVADLPPERRFGDWVVACDNLRSCHGVALPREDGDDWQLALFVTRAAGPLAQAEMEVSGMFGDELAPGRWRIDGRLVALSGGPLLRALATARRAEWVETSNGRGRELTIVGAAAALRWMDDRQGRAGTLSALVATGPRPASVVPPPPPPPRLALPRRSAKVPPSMSPATVAAIQKLADCEPEHARPVTYRLDSRHSLGIVGCWMGAYQGSALIVVIDQRGRWSPARIEQPEPPNEYFEPWHAYLLTGADYDPETRLLASFAKGRGLADCGSSGAWAWDGRVFRLASYAALGPCRGTMPGAWLRRWTTANSSGE